MIEADMLSRCLRFSLMQLFGRTFQVKWLRILVLRREELLSLLKYCLALLRG
jgi:hypothetical protein